MSPGVGAGLTYFQDTAANLARPTAQRRARGMQVDVLESRVAQPTGPSNTSTGTSSRAFAGAPPDVGGTFPATSPTTDAGLELARRTIARWRWRTWRSRLWCSRCDIACPGRGGVALRSDGARVRLHFGGAAWPAQACGTVLTTQCTECARSALGRGSSRWEDFPMPIDARGRLLRDGGAVLRDVRAATGVAIEVPPRGTADSVAVYGTRSSIPAQVPPFGWPWRAAALMRSMRSSPSPSLRLWGSRAAAGAPFAARA